MAWIPAVSAGVGVASKVFNRQRRPNIGRAVAELRASNPVGSSMLTPADYRASELTRGRLAASARSQGTLAGVDISRRSAARGLAGSPSQERDLARVGQQTALGVQNAGDSAEEQLYNIGLGREQAQRQKDLAIFEAQVNQSTSDAARQDAQNSEYWNSLNEFIPTIQSYLPAKPGTAAPAAPTATPAAATVRPAPVRGYDPSLERPVL